MLLLLRNTKADECFCARLFFVNAVKCAHARNAEKTPSLFRIPIELQVTKRSRLLGNCTPRFTNPPKWSRQETLSIIQNKNHSLVTEEITKSTTNSENTPESSNSPLVASEPAAIKEIDNNDWLIPAIEKVGLKYIDKRTTGGNLWVIGDRKIVTIISELNKKGVHFRYRESGGMATKGRSAWWMK